MRRRRSMARAHSQRFRYITLPALRPTLLAVVLPGHHLHDARVRPDLRDDPGRAARFQQRAAAVLLPVLVRSSSSSASAPRSARSPSSSCSPWRCSMCARWARRRTVRGTGLGATGINPWILTVRSARSACALYLFPIYWMFASGFKPSAEIFANPPTMVPAQPDARILPVRVRARERAALPAQQPDHRGPGHGADPGPGLDGRLCDEPPAHPADRRRPGHGADAAGVSRGAAGHADLHHLSHHRAC